MIEIKKGSEPTDLTKLRQEAAKYGLSPKEAYDTLQKPLKVQVREQLLMEQGHLCAYCMCEIPRPDAPSKIDAVTLEHLIPMRPSPYRDVGQGLDYNNLFVVCSGNSSANVSNRKRDLTCDAHKGNQEFRKLNPCKRDTLTSIYYELDGRINASDPDVAFDLTEILNLNCSKAPLVAERKAVLEGLLEDMINEREEDLLAYCKKALAKYQAEIDPKTAYVGILLWYLLSMMESLSKG